MKIGKVLVERIFLLLSRILPARSNDIICEVDRGVFGWPCILFLNYCTESLSFCCN